MADPYEKLTSDVYTEYQKRLLKNNSLDFDDLIMTTIQLFERVPEVLSFISVSSNIFTLMSIKIRIKRNIFLLNIWQRVLKSLRCR